MKENYEDRYRFYLPRRSYVIIRIDGKSFHTFTRHCEKPYDEGLRLAMTNTAIGLCENIQGANFAYCQSDEISILITDFTVKTTDAWFDYNIQKMCSVSASIATAYFHNSYKHPNNSMAFFDSRVFQIPDRVEVENYFCWRQKDAERNSISMLAQSHFSHKELHGKSCSDIHEMLHQKGINWNDVNCFDKRGTVVRKEIGLSFDGETATKERVGWFKMEDTPIFTQQRDIFKKLINVRGY
jgi:tRNA(His) 5'-end guanylyltransferase